MIFDGHADVWTDVTLKRLKGQNNIIKQYHLDNFRSGKITGGIFVVWIDPPYDKNPRARAKQIIEHMAVEVTENEDILKVITKYEHFQEAREQNKLAVLLGLEGLSFIDENVDLLHLLYLMGFRHASLTWNESNALANGAPQNPQLGLTKAGVNVIQKMEQLGMIVDVSHANEKTFWDIHDVSTKPFVASHSNVRALCDVPRNLSDEQLRAIAKRGGVVGINSYRGFICKDKKDCTLHDLVDHLDYMVRLIGIDHVGFGFDFSDYLTDDTLAHYVDSTTYGPQNFENASQAQNMIAILKQRGYSQADIEKISYQNFYRIIKEIVK